MPGKSLNYTCPQICEELGLGRHPVYTGQLSSSFHPVGYRPGTSDSGCHL